MLGMLNSTAQETGVCQAPSHTSPADKHSNCLTGHGRQRKYYCGPPQQWPPAAAPAPRLHVRELFSVEGLSIGFKRLLTCAPENVWKADIARTVSSSHPLCGAETGCRQAVRQYADLQRGIHLQDASIR